MNRRIAESIFSHKRTHKSIKALDKVASRHIIACRLDHTQNATTQLSSHSHTTSVPKGFSLSGTLFYFSSYLYERRITMKKSNSTKKALGVFKKLGAVALMVATTLTLAVFFTACNQTGGGGKGLCI
ncbi:MAG: hypothetical protein ACTTIZ_08740 [Treponema sp.]